MKAQPDRIEPATIEPPVELPAELKTLLQLDPQGEGCISDEITGQPIHRSRRIGTRQRCPRTRAIPGGQVLRRWRTFAIVALVTCPACGSDDVDKIGDATAGAIMLRCDRCRHEWAREPRVVCGRCGSGDVEIGAYEGWAYDDIEEARDGPDGSTWAYIDREVFRCRKCNHRWRHSGEPRPYLPLG